MSIVDINGNVLLPLSEPDENARIPYEPQREVAAIAEAQFRRDVKALFEREHAKLVDANLALTAKLALAEKRVQILVSENAQLAGQLFTLRVRIRALEANRHDRH